MLKISKILINSMERTRLFARFLSRKYERMFYIESIGVYPTSKQAVNGMCPISTAIALPPFEQREIRIALLIQSVRLLCLFATSSSLWAKEIASLSGVRSMQRSIPSQITRRERRRHCYTTAGSRETDQLGRPPLARCAGKRPCSVPEKRACERLDNRRERLRLRDGPDVLSAVDTLFSMHGCFLRRSTGC
jgi:hypothetical protein